MSDPRYPRDPFDQSQYRQQSGRHGQVPAHDQHDQDDPYGQESWMLDPDASGPGADLPFDWGEQPGAYQPPAGPPPGRRAAPQGPPPQGPPPAYRPDEQWQHGDAYETGGYRTGAWETGPYETQSGHQTGQYQTGQYQTGQYQTGEYQTGAWETGGYQTGQYDAYEPQQSGQYETGAYQTGQYDAYRSGEYETGAYRTGYETGQYGAVQTEPEAWPTAAEMRGPGEDDAAEPDTGDVPVPQAILRRVRRQRGRGFDATVLAAAVLVAVTALALVATRPHPWEQPSLAAHTSTPQSATAMCPSKVKGTSDSIGIANAAASGSGPVKLTGAGASGAGQANVSAGRLTSDNGGAGAVTVKAGPQVAAGLIAGRSTTKPLAATDCGPPQAVAWFSGVGAGAAHDSVLELTNPNSGSATVDVALFDAKGPIAVPDEMRGIAVPGNTTRTFDLLHEIPREGSMALSTTVVRGQIGATVRDRAVDVVSGAATEDWMPGQSQPAAVNRLVGLPAKVDDAELSVANPSDDQVSVTLKLMTPQAILTPQGAPTIDIPPHGVTTADLTKVLATAGDAYGLEVTSGKPVTTTLRTVDEGDVSLTTPAQTVTAQTALVLPTGGSISSKKVLVANEAGTGTVTVTALNGNGKTLRTKDVKLAANGGAEVPVPPQTALVQLKPVQAKVHAAVLINGNGDTVVPFRPMQTVARSAGVAPGLPMPLQPDGGE